MVCCSQFPSRLIRLHEEEEEVRVHVGRANSQQRLDVGQRRNLHRKPKVLTQFAPFQISGSRSGNSKATLIMEKRVRTGRPAQWRRSSGALTRDHSETRGFQFFHELVEAFGRVPWRKEVLHRHL